MTEIKSTRTYADLKDMSREQLMNKIMELYKRIDRLEEWKLDVLELNSTIGLDIDWIQAIRMKEHFDNLSGASDQSWEKYI